MSEQLDAKLQAYREEHGERCEHGALKGRSMFAACAGRPTSCACCGSRFCGVASSVNPTMPTLCRECRP